MLVTGIAFTVLFASVFFTAGQIRRYYIRSQIRAIEADSRQYYEANSIVALTFLKEEKFLLAWTTALTSGMYKILSTTLAASFKPAPLAIGIGCSHLVSWLTGPLLELKRDW